MRFNHGSVSEYFDLSCILTNDVQLALLAVWQPAPSSSEIVVLLACLPAHAYLYIDVFVYVYTHLHLSLWEFPVHRGQCCTRDSAPPPICTVVDCVLVTSLGDACKTQKRC